MVRKPSPFSLSDEVKLLLLRWECDPEWMRLPLPVREALTMAINEIKTDELLKRAGQADERLEDGDGFKKEKLRFIAVFKQKYVEYSDLPFEETIDQAGHFIIGTLVNKLIEQGTNSLEYLAWFFDDFMSVEYNKQKYAPPSIKVACANWVVSKYLFANKERLKVRKRDLQDYKLKNAVVELANQYLSSTMDVEFGKKVRQFSSGELSVRKFGGIFAALLKKNLGGAHGEGGLLERLKGILGASTPLDS